MAEEDWSAAGVLLDAGLRRSTVFHLHLAVEKTLKALMWEETGTQAPYTHELLRLAPLANVVLDPARLQFLGTAFEAGRYSTLRGVSNLFGAILPQLANTDRRGAAMVKTKTDVDSTIKEFIERLQLAMPVDAVFYWDGGLDYASIPVMVISPYFETHRTAEWEDPLVKAAMPAGAELTIEIVTAWGFSPGQLGHDPYSPLLEMMLQDAHQVYPAPEAPTRPARKAKAGHVN